MFGIVASATFNRQAAGVRGAASFRQLRRNVGVFTVRGGTIGWLMNDSGTLVVDSQYADTAAACLAGLRERGTMSIDTLINTHHHAAHTGGDCTVFFERANIVHMGDLVFNRAYPFVDADGGASVRGWIDLLDTVAVEHDADTIYIFGHARAGADVTGGREDILYQRDFLRAALDTSERAIATGQNRAEATSLETLRGFGDYAPLVPRLDLGAVIGAAFDELTTPSLPRSRLP